MNKKLIFISNVVDNLKIEQLSSILGDVSNIEIVFMNLDSDSDIKNIIEEYGDNTIITEKILLSAYPNGMYKKITSENIEDIKSLFKGIKLTDDERDMSIEYEYSIYIDKKLVSKRSKDVKCVIANKKVGKSSLYFENYIMNIPEWEMMSKISIEDKEKMTNQSFMLKELYAYYVCYVNNIDVERLRVYSDNMLVDKFKDSEDYDVSYEYSIMSENIDSLSVKYKKYILSRRAINPNWFLSKSLSYPINLSEIDTKLNECDEFIEKEKEKEKAEKEKAEKEAIEKEKADLTSSRSSYSSGGSSSHSHYSSDFDEADYNRRGREGHGWSSEIGGFTNDEVEDYHDRVYKRNHGGSGPGL